MAIFSCRSDNQDLVTILHQIKKIDVTRVNAGKVQLSEDTRWEKAIVSMAYLKPEPIANEAGLDSDETVKLKDILWGNELCKIVLIQKGKIIAYSSIKSSVEISRPGYLVISPSEPEIYFKVNPTGHFKIELGQRF